MGLFHKSAEKEKLEALENYQSVKIQKGEVKSSRFVIAPLM